MDVRALSRSSKVYPRGTPLGMDATQVVRLTIPTTNQTEHRRRRMLAGPKPVTSDETKEVGPVVAMDQKTGISSTDTTSILDGTPQGSLSAVLGDGPGGATVESPACLSRLLRRLPCGVGRTRARRTA